MSARFEIPDWLLPAEPPEPPSPVDDLRVEALVNRFIAAKQEALFTAPDAYYRTTGVDAVSGSAGIRERLGTLRGAVLDEADDDTIGSRSASVSTRTSPKRATASADTPRPSARRCTGRSSPSARP